MPNNQNPNDLNHGNHKMITRSKRKRSVGVNNVIEINDNFHEQSDTCEKILKECGLKFLFKKNSNSTIIYKTL